MSFIYNELKKKNYFSHYVFPDKIVPKDLIGTPDSAVIAVLKPNMKKEIFVEKNQSIETIRDLIDKIPDERSDYYIFMLNCKQGIFCQNYPPGFPLTVMKYKNDNGYYDRELGFDTWMLKFSSHFVSRRSVILGRQGIFHKFMKGIEDGIIKDELSGVSGLLSLQYF